MKAWTKRRVAQVAGVGIALVALGGLGCDGGGDGTGWTLGDGGNATSSGSGGGSGAGGSSGTGLGGSSGGGSGGGSGSSSGSSSGSGSGSSSGSGSGSSSGSSSGAADASAPDSSVADATTPVPDSGDPLAAARALCVMIINQDRATLSPPSPPLTESTKDEACVDQQAQADFVANTAHSAFGMCKEFAQDECPGWPGPPDSIMTGCLKDMWAEGPPPAGQDNHWLNMSNASYTKVACGFYQTPSGDWWATQDFW